MGRDTLDALAPTHEVRERGPVRLALRRDWLEVLPAEALLDDLPLERWGRPVPDHGLRGRGAVHVLATDAGELVAKRVGRGGLLGRWLPDRYLDGLRGFREALLAERLVAAGVATPPRVVVRSVRVGGLHRWETASARLPAARDLQAVLEQEPADGRPALALRVGAFLRRLHDAGLAHRDLQVKNLLLSAEGRPWILDLDGCRLVPGGLDGPRALASLARFGRSLVKRGLLEAPTAGAPAPASVRAFWRGYGARAGQGRAAALAEVDRRLRRQLRWHALLWGRGSRASEG